jgi:hypothetical protein
MTAPAQPPAQPPAPPMQQQMSPEQEVQDPMSYDEVISDLQAEIGQLTVNLRVAQRQNSKNVNKWVKDKEQYESTIARLSSRLAELEGTDEPSIDTDAAAEEESPKGEQIELAVGESTDVPLTVEPAPMPDKPRAKQRR